MYAKNVLAISGALLAAVSAVPMAEKRDMVWVTHTDVVIETVLATQTVWIDPSQATAPAAHYGHGHGHSHGHRTSTVLSSVTVAPSSESPSDAPVPSSSSSSSSSSYVPPTTSSVYVAPTTSSSSVYVAPTTSSSSSVYVAPTTPSSVYVAPSSTSSSAASASTSASSGTAPSGSYTGDITHYDVGMGSCGQTNTDSEMVVAIPSNIMNNGANPNNNPLCGTTITISYNGQETQGTVVDTCGGCFTDSIDLSPALFTKVAPNGDGRVHDVTWWFN